MTGFRPSTSLDAVDRTVVAAIQRDGRVSLTDLAREVNLGISATRVRLQRLEERGVIGEYTARVDAAALGYALRAVVRLSVKGFQDKKVFDILKRQQQIVRCLRVTGEICFIMEIVATDMGDLERVTSELAKLGVITTDLIYEILLERPIP